MNLVDVFACVLFVGAGLTSASMAVWSHPSTSYATQAAQVIELALHEDESPPDELLIAGAALEELVTGSLAEVLDRAAIETRLVADDAPIKAVRDTYWVLGRRDHLPDTPTGYESRTAAEHDGLVIDVWTATERPHATRLADRVRGARAVYASEADGTKTLACTRWRFGRLFCGPNTWNWVGATDVTIDGKQKRCIWAHPLVDHELRITFPGVRLEQPMRGGYGIADDAVGKGKMSPITFRVFVDGKEQVKRVLPDAKGWNAFTLPAPKGEAHKDDKPVDLTFVVSAPHDGRRHFCFDGELQPHRE